MKPVFIPEPRTLTMGKGTFCLPRTRTIGISDNSLYAVAKEARRVLGRGPIGAIVADVADTLTLSLNADLESDGYQLEIGSAGIVMEARSPRSAFCALQTFRQLLRQCPDGTLPRLCIRDWPDFADRGVYYDVARGRVPKLDQLLEMADKLAHYKINQLQLYIEHTFRFRAHPDIGRGASPLTAEDILTLDEFCADRGIELVPSLSTFGHLASVLHHKRYRELAEDFGEGRYLDPEFTRKPQKGWSLAPANPKTYEFLDSLFAEFLPLFRSKRFNVCCDETYDLGRGQSYELCRRIGPGQLYLNHIKRLDQLSRKYNKRIMMWGDIIRHYPELIAKLPKSVTLLDWKYGASDNFAEIDDFKKSGLAFYACPSTSGYVALFPRLHESSANIHGFARMARDHQANGILNTDWGDGGHYNFMECAWYGYLCGAEQSWNVDADRGSFRARFAKLFLGSDRRDVADAIGRLGDVTHLRVDGFYQSVWLHIFFAAPGNAVFEAVERNAAICRNGRIARKKMILNASVGLAALKELESAREPLAALASARSGDPNRVLDYWIFSVDTLILAARKLMALGAGGNDTPEVRRSLIRDQGALMKRFERLWMARNRRSEIRLTLDRYRQAMDALQQD